MKDEPLGLGAATECPCEKESHRLLAAVLTATGVALLVGALFFVKSRKQ